jgi:predicted  nucleic acid-binding Zn-ribbon protein
VQALSTTHTTLDQMRADKLQAERERDTHRANYEQLQGQISRLENTVQWEKSQRLVAEKDCTGTSDPKP